MAQAIAAAQARPAPRLLVRNQNDASLGHARAYVGKGCPVAGYSKWLQLKQKGKGDGNQCVESVLRARLGNPSAARTPPAPGRALAAASAGAFALARAASRFTPQKTAGQFTPPVSSGGEHLTRPPQVRGFQRGEAGAGVSLPIF